MEKKNIVTRRRSVTFFPPLRRSCPRPLAATDDWFPTAREKIPLMPREPEWQYHIFWRGGGGGTHGVNKTREDKFRTWIKNSLKKKKNKRQYIKVCDLIAYKHSLVLCSGILEEDDQKISQTWTSKRHSVIFSYFLAFWSFHKSLVRKK